MKRQEGLATMQSSALGLIGPYYRFWPYYQISGGFNRALPRVRLANRGRLLLWTPGPVQFGTCICSNVETILSWTCHVYRPFEFRTSLGTSILLHIGAPDLRVTIMKVRRREIWYRSTESVKRLPAMTYMALNSKTFMNTKCHQTCVSRYYQVNRLCPQFQNFILVGVECSKSEVKSVIP